MIETKHVIQISNELYSDIKEYCNFNNLKIPKFINEMIKQGFLVEKYGNTPFSSVNSFISETNQPQPTELYLEEMPNTLGKKVVIKTGEEQLEYKPIVTNTLYVDENPFEVKEEKTEEEKTVEKKEEVKEEPVDNLKELIKTLGNDTHETTERIKKRWSAFSDNNPQEPQQNNKSKKRKLK